MRKILSFGKVEAFDDQLTRTMAEAFEMSWKGLCDNGHPGTLSSREITTREIMARRIVHLAKQGVTDPTRLSAEAITVILATDFRPATRHLGKIMDSSKNTQPRYTGL